ncbi:MAG: diadenylate cyclase CdaA [Victivallaceae bacterium]|nr:diadenylate cyclase CdaA [Victivallaceae bacterium]
MPIMRSILEVLILTYLIYKALYYLRGTRGSYVLAGILIMLLTLTILAPLLKFEVIAWLLENASTITAFALVVIFQPELRRAFAQLGSYAFWQSGRQREVLSEIAIAAADMSRIKCGAIIVLVRKIQMKAIVDDSVKLDIRVSAIVLESIFFPNSPMHDGAVVIDEDRIIAARAILPLTRVENAKRSWGTRHRAAIGITEESDAVALVVSEETGKISVAFGGRLRRDIPVAVLEEYLRGLMTQGCNEPELASNLRLPPLEEGLLTREEI